MTSEQIKLLLEKYWACDTSIEEELVLRTFFSGNTVPEELRKYQPLFLWKTKQLQLKGNGKPTTVKKQASFQWYSFLKIAASVLLIFTLGISINTHYQQEKQMDKIFSDTYSDPEDALRETQNVIGKISSALNLAKNKQDEVHAIDSLEQTPKKNTVE